MNSQKSYFEPNLKNSSILHEEKTKEITIRHVGSCVCDKNSCYFTSGH
jgi:hypothetical protein